MSDFFGTVLTWQFKHNMHFPLLFRRSFTNSGWHFINSSAFIIQEHGCFFDFDDLVSLHAETFTFSEPISHQIDLLPAL